MRPYEELDSEMKQLLEMGANNNTSIQSIAASRYMDYGTSIILSRALPDIRDGLKPVHRRILQSMKDLHLSPTGAPKKSARIVGNCIGIYHPHGDTSVYDAMVALAQDWTKHIPLVIGQGNFGSIDKDNPAAMRYTESKLSKGGALFFQDIDKSTVDYQDNYDSTELEPTVLPVPFPNLLINGGFGVAVGMASNIPSHNPKEIMDSLLYVIRQKKAGRNVSIDKLATIIQGPDFPTGGIIHSLTSVKEIIENGNGKFKLRAKHRIVDLKRGKKAIIVYEIPYQTVKSKIVKEIADLVNLKAIDGIVEVRDDSNKEGLEVYIELKANIDPVPIWNILVKKTDLETDFKYNFTVIKDMQPVESGILEALEAFVDFRMDIQNRKYTHILKIDTDRLEIVNGLLIALADIDNVLKILRTSEDEPAAMANLKSKLKVTDRQAKSILAMRMQRLIGLEKIKLEKEFTELSEAITFSQSIIDSDILKYDILISESKAVSKEISFPRKTIIDNDIVIMEITDTVANEDSMVYISDKGYFRRVPYTSVSKGLKGSEGIELQEGDVLTHSIRLMSHDMLLFVSKKGKVYSIKVHTLSDTIKGRYIENILTLDHGDEIIRVFNIESFSDNFVLATMSKQGYIKSTLLTQYEGSLRQGGVIGTKVTEGDSIVSAYIRDVSDENNTLVISSKGKFLNFNSSEIPVVGRNSRGVIGIRMDEGDYVVSTVQALSSDRVLIIFDSGQVQSNDIELFDTKRRAGKGVFIAKPSKKHGSIAKAIIIKNSTENELLLTSDSEFASEELSLVFKKSNRLSGFQFFKTDLVKNVYIRQRKES